MSMLLSTEAWSPVCVLGALFGCASALLCAALINSCVATSASVEPGKAAATLPVLSRRERAEKQLEEMRAQRAGGPSAQGGTARANATNKDAGTGGVGEGCDAHGTPEGSSSSGDSSWASTSEDSDGEESEEDSEYERMEDLRLKMVFVVRHPVQPKMTAQEVAVLTASAGVQLIEKHQAGGHHASASPNTVKGGASAASGPLSSIFVPDAEDQQRWRHWYVWWNRIGCAKIALKCPETSTMDTVMAMAAEMHLPVVLLHRSQFSTQEGIMAQNAPPGGADEVVVIAMGPAPSDVLEPVTGALKLFS